ncbi:MAG TPA: acyl-CoA thioesterase [Sedimenticola thiotaurini]|uniref:Acyl-CoA thioesterase n=1 Tax=Sedimenticola thiotaurini TaxID=1543721 RepID=A0A831RL65_9GAMM|nr:acyl-CoA thioesterase [Sedimenticola thiotaurini]
MKFGIQLPVRFEHCDPAGIVFYPRYVEMLHRVVEDWFDQGLGLDYRRLHDELKSGIPTVRLECDFVRPSRLGDRLDFELAVLEIRSSAFTLAVTAGAGGEERLRARLVLVFVTIDGGIDSRPLPESLRAAMTRYLA